MVSTTSVAESAGMDPTDLYVRADPVSTNDDQLLWQSGAEVRGSYPGYRDLPPALSDARVHLTPVFLCAAAPQHSFCIPNSAIERVVLAASQTVPQSRVLLVDYCDADGTLRRMWLKLLRRSQNLQKFLPRTQVVPRFLSAGVTAMETASFVPGITQFVHGRQLASAEVIWSGQAAVSLASGDFVANVHIMPDRIRCEVMEQTLDIPITDVLGYDIRVDRVQHQRYLFIHFDEQDHRIDLRLHAISANAAHPQPDTLDRLSDVLDGLALPAETSPATAHRRNSQAGPDSPELRYTDSPATHVDLEWHPKDLVQRVRQHVVRATDCHESDLQQGVAEQLGVATTLHAQGLINDDEFNAWRSRAIATARLITQLNVMRLLKDAELLTDSEFDEWHRSIVAKMFG